MKKSRFTLIEIMFVVTIIVILIGQITKVIRKQKSVQTKSELTMLKAAIESYKIRWGEYPEQSSTSYLNFAQRLSKVKPGAGWTGLRPMFIDFKASNFNMSNDNYNKSNAGSATVNDPYGGGYVYLTNVHDHVATCVSTCRIPESFLIYSLGLDGKQGKWASGGIVPYTGDPGTWKAIDEYKADLREENDDNIRSDQK